MITDAQVKAVLEVLQYTARQVVELRKDFGRLLKAGNESQKIRRLRERNARLVAEHATLKQQYEELIKFQ